MHRPVRRAAAWRPASWDAEIARRHLSAAPGAAAEAASQGPTRRPLAGAAASPLGICSDYKRDFQRWYIETLLKAELMDYSAVSGFHIMRPYAMAIWGRLQEHIKGCLATQWSPPVQEVYFPTLIPEAALHVERDHIEGFAPEVAWVTHAGSAPLHERLAIRPTSETAIYPAFARWIQSYRDLPLVVNQWCSVVRWEGAAPMPFIRSREFLWQEGHGAFACAADAAADVARAIAMYAHLYTALLAVPVVVGAKSVGERFGGALSTDTVEVLIPPSGKAIQGATAHNLGQNFSRMFGIAYDDQHGAGGGGGGGEREKSMREEGSTRSSKAGDGNVKKSTAEGNGHVSHAFQSCWGFTTRSIGIAAMVHGDALGLVLPPMVAPIQVVIVPVGIGRATPRGTVEGVHGAALLIEAALLRGGVRARADLGAPVLHPDGSATREARTTPGFKFNHWELRGVPLRIEVGPRELQEGAVTLVARNTAARTTEAFGDLYDAAADRSRLCRHVQARLADIQAAMYETARRAQRSGIRRARSWASFVDLLGAEGTVAVLAPWCSEGACERAIKQRLAPGSGVKVLCIPHDQQMGTGDDAPPPAAAAGAPGACFQCGHAGDGVRWALFGRSL